MTEELITDPLKFQQLCWPHITFYDKQVDILYSLQENEETVVRAGNDLGKDFIAAFAALWFFCSRTPAKVITTSSGQSQLKSVLWGEIGRFIAESKYPLPIQENSLWLKQIVDGREVPNAYMKGMVTSKDENLQGHHLPWGPDGLPRTLGVLDEASGIDDEYYNAIDTWAHRKLIIGNPLPTTNFFFRSSKKGDVRSDEEGEGLHVKVIHISGNDSPNVRLAKSQEKKGYKVTHEELVPGVLSYREYKRRKKLWDKIRLCIGLNGQFYEGAETLMFPPDWLDRAHEIADKLASNRKPETLGVDPAEGGDSSVWTPADNRGIIDQTSKKTPNTAQIPNETIALIKQYGLDPTNVIFDRGGGGKEHADQCRERGYEVRTVGFGEAASDPSEYKRMQTSSEKEEAKETRYVFKNRRAEMYGLLRWLINPLMNPEGFGIPGHLTELRRQLAPIPLQYDPEGRMYLPPKDKRSKTSKEVTLKEILGCSPDEADSAVLSVFGLFSPAPFVVSSMV